MGTVSRSGSAALIPSGRKMKSYACMRSLHRRGIRTVVASEFDEIPHFSSRYCSERVRLGVSPNYLPGYKDALRELAARPDVETIVPVREYDVYVLSKYHEEFDPLVSMVVPDFETLETAHDRLRLFREARCAGVPVPETRLLSDSGGWDARRVVKSRYNLLTSDVVDTLSPGEAREVKNVCFLRPEDTPDQAVIRERMSHDPIVQEFVPQADKHLYCALWDHGEPVVTYQHRQIRQNSWVGGGGVYRVSTADPEVERVAAELLGHLDWHGLVCIEYLKDERDGQWKFLEINPRVWQSMPEAVRAGADFPYAYWSLAQDDPERIDVDYEVGVGCHIAYGELSYLRSILYDRSPFVERPSFAASVWDVATSCIANPRFDYLRLDDPGIVVGSARELFSRGVTSSRHYETGVPTRARLADGGERDH